MPGPLFDSGAASAGIHTFYREQSVWACDPQTENKGRFRMSAPGSYCTRDRQSLSVTNELLLVRGGHSGPQSNVNVKGGGQECPPHTNTSLPRAPCMETGLVGWASKSRTPARACANPAWT